MNKILFSLFFIYFFINAEALLAKPNGDIYPYVETMQMDLPEKDQKNWKCVYKAASPYGQSVVKWIRKDQSLKDFSEMIAIQFFAAQPKEEKTAIESMQAFQKQMKNKDPFLEWNVIKKSEDDVIFEWRFSGKAVEPQHELVRFVCSKRGLHKVAYNKRVAQMNSKERLIWIDLLEKAEIKNNR